MSDPSKRTVKRGGSFLGGVVVLTVANLAVKLLGFLYKVPLNGLLGDEMANVNAAYSVYTLLYMLSTAGVPVAVSLLVSEARASGRGQAVPQILRVSLIILAFLGLLGTGGMLVFAAPIANANSGGDSYLCLLAIAPALLFICISSVFRGYFQGFGRMTPTAVSGVIEAAGKTLLGLFFVHAVLRAGGDTRLGGAYSVLAITVGIALGTLYLVVVFHRARRSGMLPDSFEGEGASAREVAGRLFRIALPIAASSGVLSLASLIDNQVMRPLLEGYYGDVLLAKAVFSDYSTGAVTLFNMPTVLVYPIASAIVPYLTAARSRGDAGEVGRYISSALRMATLIALPCALGMSALAHPILSLLFVGDADMAQHAGDPLAILSLSIIPLALLAVTNSVLQAVGKQGKPILSMLFGVAVKMAVLYGLTPRLGSLAAPLGTLLFYLTALGVNLVFVLRYTSFSFDLLRGLLAPLLAAVLCASAATAVHRWLSAASAPVAMGAAIAAAALVYLTLVLLTGAIRGEDMAFFPHGERLSRLMTRGRSRGQRRYK